MKLRFPHALRLACARLIRHQGGIAAVEFAMTLPLMLALLFGGEEFARLLIIQEKAEKVATSIADMVSQETAVTNAELADIMNAGTQMMKPFPFGSSGKVIVSSVTMTGTQSGSNLPKVSWQYSGGGTMTGGSKIGSTGGTANLPVGFAMNDKDNIIVTEVYYKFTPLFNGFTPLHNETLYEMTIYKPRLGALTNPPT